MFFLTTTYIVQYRQLSFMSIATKWSVTTVDTATTQTVTTVDAATKWSVTTVDISPKWSVTTVDPTRRGGGVGEPWENSPTLSHAHCNYRQPSLL